jgi:hexokinase
VNDFLLGKGGQQNPLVANWVRNEGNTEGYFQIMNEVLKRAAKFAAIALVAVATRSEARDNYAAPLLISIDGSSYAGAYFYRERIEAYLWKHLKKQHNLSYEVVRPENASLLGASVAAMG